MKNRFAFLIFLSLFLTKLTFGQDKSALGPNEFFMMHYYTFEGVMDQSKIDALEQNLSNLQFVAEAKVKYKPEKNRGQIVLVVKEKTVTSEGDKVFSPTSVKQTILSSGLTPMEYSVGQYERK